MLVCAYAYVFVLLCISACFCMFFNSFYAYVCFSFEFIFLNFFQFLLHLCVIVYMSVILSEFRYVSWFDFVKIVCI